MKKTKGKCSACGDDAHCRELCRKHYNAAYKSKSISFNSARLSKGASLAERIAFYSEPSQIGDGCILWMAEVNNHGYGRLQVNGKPEYAHRVAYRLANGEIPDGLCVLHKCDNPSCVNTDHLFVGSHLENIADRDEKKRTRGRRQGLFVSIVGRAKKNYRDSLAEHHKQLRR